MKKNIVKYASIIAILLLLIITGYYLAKIELINNFFTRSINYITDNFTNTGLMIYSILTVITLMILIYLINRLNLVNKLLSYYKLDLNGLIILEINHFSSQKLDFSEFKEGFSAFEEKFSFIDANINYTNECIKIELRTPGEIMVKNGEDILNKLNWHLGKLMESVPSQHILINVNIKGMVSNLFKQITFTINNNKNKVGLRKNTRKKMLLKVHKVDS